MKHIQTCKADSGLHKTNVQPRHTHTHSHVDKNNNILCATCTILCRTYSNLHETSITSIQLYTTTIQNLCKPMQTYGKHIETCLKQAGPANNFRYISLNPVIGYVLEEDGETGWGGYICFYWLLHWLCL